MNDQRVLHLPRLPARSDVSQAALLLGFQEYEIPILMRLRLLKPLGSPVQNGRKFFATAEILELAQSRDWLDRATRAVAKSFQEKNRRIKERQFAGNGSV
jgi:hypothetical protein